MSPWSQAFQHRPRQRDSFRVAFWPLRGGIGNTTCSLIAAWKHALIGRKTVLADMCFHKPNDYNEITHGWDIPPDYGSLQWLAGNHPEIAKTDLGECQHAPDWSQHLIMTPILGEDSEEYLKDLHYSEAFLQEDGVQKLIQTLETHNQAQSMIFDCAPAMNPVTCKVIRECDHVMILHSDTASEWGLFRSLLEECNHAFLQNMKSCSLVFAKPENCDLENLPERNQSMQEDYQNIRKEFPVGSSQTMALCTVLEKDSIRYGISTGTTMPYAKHFANMQNTLQEALEGYLIQDIES